MGDARPRAHGGDDPVPVQPPRTPAAAAALLAVAACCSCPEQRAQAPAPLQRRRIQRKDSEEDSPEPEAADSNEWQSTGAEQAQSSSLGPRAPRRLLSYEVSKEQPVEGRLVRQGNLLIFDGEEGSMSPWTVLLFSNGFYAVPQGGGSPSNGKTVGAQSCAWSPFAEVRELTAEQEEGTPFAGFPAFALFLFTQDLGYIFATCGQGAVKERGRWVAAMTASLRAFTASLFPSVPMTTSPLPEVPSTRTRILAGYLMRDDGAGVAGVPYCELHAPCTNVAVFAMYDDERCERLECTVPITMVTPIFERESAACGCFTIESFRFCARSAQESCVWIRALRNIKTKLLNHAPPPTREDLKHWRQAIRDCSIRLGAAPGRRPLSPGCEGPGGTSARSPRASTSPPPPPPPHAQRVPCGPTPSPPLAKARTATLALGEPTPSGSPSTPARGSGSRPTDPATPPPPPPPSPPPPEAGPKASPGSPRTEEGVGEWDLEPPEDELLVDERLLTAPDRVVAPTAEVERQGDDPGDSEGTAGLMPTSSEAQARAAAAADGAHARAVPVEAPRRALPVSYVASPPSKQDPIGPATLEVLLDHATRPGPSLGPLSMALCTLTGRTWLCQDESP